MRIGTDFNGFVILIVALVVVVVIAAARWKWVKVQALNQGSQIAETAAGPVEYATLGVGAPVLVLHGSPGGYDQGLFLAEFLSGANRQFIVPSRPGYLRTPLATGASFEAQADALAALLDTLNIQQVGVVGASGGGPTALQFALRHPERTASLVLMSALTQQMHIPVESMNNPLSKTFIGNWFVLNMLWIDPSMLGAENATSPEQTAKALELAETAMPLDIRWAGLMNDAALFDTLPVYPLENIQTPTLVVQGEADMNVPLAHAEFAANTIPNAELIMIAGGSHGMSSFTPEAQARVGAFLDQHAANR